MTKTPEHLHETKSDFGAYGWSVVIAEAVLLWIGTGCQIQGLNIIIPTLSDLYGIEPNTLLYWATPASWGSIVAAFIVARFCERKGARLTIILSLVLCAVCFGLLGFCGSLVGFAVLLFGVCFFCTGYAFVGGLALVANWFPLKKNLALGWITMGSTLSSALFIPIFAGMIDVMGPQYGFSGMSAAMLVLALVTAAFIHNLPEEVGCSPDNIPMSAEKIEASRKQQEAYVFPLTVAQLLKMRDVWFLSVGTGGIYIVVVGILSQVIPRLMAMGYDRQTAILYWTVAALVGVPSGYLWGWLGQRLGSKSSIILYCLWWLVAIVLNLFESQPALLLISLVMIGTSLGGSTNLATAIVAEKFPRGAFIKAFGIIAPIQGMLRCCAFSVLAFGLNSLGGYSGAYAILAAIAGISMALFWIIDLTPVGESASLPCPQEA